MITVEEIKDFLSQFIRTGQDITDVLFSLVLAIVMGFLISQLYKKTHRGLNYEHTFMATLVLLAPIVTVVMLYIRGDLVLSLGLIGSLSIIRFRTPIKDTRDMVFLFWVIAVGLGAGTFNWGVVGMSTIIIAIVVGLLYFFRYGNSGNTDFVLVINGQEKFLRNEVEKLLDEYTIDVRIRSYDTQEGAWEIIYELRFKNFDSHPADALVEKLQALEGLKKVSLLAPQLSLPL
jgi:hypothetical protein